MAQVQPQPVVKPPEGKNTQAHPDARKLVPRRTDESAKIRELIRRLGSGEGVGEKRTQAQLLKYGGKAVPYLFEAALDVDNDRKAQKAAGIIGATGIRALPFLISRLGDPLTTHGNTAYYLANQIIAHIKFEGLPQGMPIVYQLDQVLRTGKTVQERMLTAYLLGSMDSSEAAKPLVNALLDKDRQVAREAERQLFRLDKKATPALIDGLFASAEYNCRHKDDRSSSEKRRLDELAEKAEEVLIKTCGRMTPKSMRAVFETGFDALGIDKLNELATAEEKPVEEELGRLRSELFDKTEEYCKRLGLPLPKLNAGYKNMGKYMDAVRKNTTAYYDTLPDSEKEKYKYVAFNSFDEQFETGRKMAFKDSGIANDAVHADLEVAWAKNEKLRKTLLKIPGCEQVYIDRLREYCIDWDRNADNDPRWTNADGFTLEERAKLTFDNFKETTGFVGSREKYLDFLIEEHGRATSVALKNVLDAEIQKVSAKVSAR